MGADEDIADLKTEFDTGGQDSTESVEAETGVDGTAESSSESVADGADTVGGTSKSVLADVKASPKAERRADELGVDLTTVDGTWPARCDYRRRRRGCDRHHDFGDDRYVGDGGC